MIILADQLKGLVATQIFCAELVISENFVKDTAMELAHHLSLAELCDDDHESARGTIRLLFSSQGRPFIAQLDQKSSHLHVEWLGKP